MGPVANVVKDIAEGTTKVAMGMSGTLCATACAAVGQKKLAGEFWDVSKKLYDEGSKTAPIISEARGIAEGIGEGNFGKIASNVGMLALNGIPGGGSIGKVAGKTAAKTAAKSAATNIALKQASKGITKSVAKDITKKTAQSTVKKAVTTSAKSIGKFGKNYTLGKINQDEVEGSVNNVKDGTVGAVNAINERDWEKLGKSALQVGTAAVNTGIPGNKYLNYAEKGIKYTQNTVATVSSAAQITRDLEQGRYKDALLNGVQAGTALSSTNNRKYGSLTQVCVKDGLKRVHDQVDNLKDGEYHIEEEWENPPVQYDSSWKDFQIAYDAKDSYDPFVTLINGTSIICHHKQEVMARKPWKIGGFRIMESATVDMNMKMALVHHEKFDKYFIFCRGTKCEDLDHILQALAKNPRYPGALKVSQYWQKKYPVEAIAAHSQGCALAQRMSGKKLLVYPWKVEKQFLVEPALLIYGSNDFIAGTGSASNAMNNYKMGSHVGLNTQEFNSNHDIDEHAKDLVSQYRNGNPRRRKEIEKFF